MAVLADMAITERQKRVLIDVYTSFVKENEKAEEAPQWQAPSNDPSLQSTARAAKQEGESDA